MALTPDQSARVRAAAYGQNVPPGSAFDKPNPNTRTAQLATPDTTQAPPNAPAAPTAGANNLFVGLCDALNQNQQDLVKAGRQQYADIYEIKFAPASLAAATVNNSTAATDITVTAMQTPNSAAKLNPGSNSVKTNTQSYQVQAGTQIVQLIDQIMRNSSYITDQQLWKYDPIPDPKTGKQLLKKNPAAGTGVTAWYKISVQSTVLQYDNIRRDNALRMTFVINAYALADLHSDYFSPIPYRGVHKSYNYWFTGLNTQVLNYEQQIDNMYRLTITGNGNLVPQLASASYRDQYRKTYMALSANRGLGKKGPTNDPADNAASFLYDLASMNTAKMEIVGDPAWMQQGEVSTGINWPNFNFNPFNADGGINFDSQQVLFDISFNQPADYNFQTGIMNVNANNTSLNGPLGGLPHENFTYVANRCKSIFSKGKFTQQLEGKLKMESPTTGGGVAAVGATSNSRQQIAGTNAVANAVATGSRTLSNTSSISLADQQNPELWNDGTASDPSNPDPYADPSITTQPASPPGVPTSTGDITLVDESVPPDAGNNSEPVPDSTSPPQQIAQDD